jgi:hypothetical protein
MKQLFFFAGILILSFCIATAFSLKAPKVYEPVRGVGATGAIECEGF